jgi:transposase
MEVLYPRCAGLDVHNDVVQQQQVRGFRTTASGMLDLPEWLDSNSCTHVAMETTGDG